MAAFNGVSPVCSTVLVSVHRSEHGALYTAVGHGVCVCGFVNEVSVASDGR